MKKNELESKGDGQKILLSLGANEGNMQANFDMALQKIEVNIGEILKASSRYTTEPWGYKNQNYFLNQVLLVQTKLTGHEVFVETSQIEQLFGRKRSASNQYGPRTMDIDLLFVEDQIIENEHFDCATSAIAFEEIYISSTN